MKRRKFDRQVKSPSGRESEEGKGNTSNQCIVMKMFYSTFDCKYLYIYFLVLIEASNRKTKLRFMASDSRGERLQPPSVK